jgi:hypothetical protein
VRLAYSVLIVADPDAFYEARGDDCITQTDLRTGLTFTRFDVDGSLTEEEVDALGLGPAGDQ